MSDAPYRVRLHPKVRADLLAIHGLLAGYAGEAAALRKLTEIEAAIRRLALAPHVGSLRDRIVPGLRAIPAARRAVIAFVVDDAAREVRVLVVSYAGSDWTRRAGGRI